MTARLISSRVGSCSLLLALGLSPAAAAADATTTGAAPHPSFPWSHVPLYVVPGTNPPAHPPLDSRQKSLLTLFSLSASNPVTGGTGGLASLGSIVSLAPQPAATNLTSPLLDLQRRHAQTVLTESQQAYNRGDLEEAIGILRKGAGRISDADLLFRIYHRLGAYLFKARRYAAAAEYMKKALELRPGNPALACNLAAAQMTMGDVDRALETLSFVPVSLIANSNLLFSIYFNYACAYALKGDTEQALDNLENAARCDPEATLASIGDVQLDSIRTHPRFQRLLADLEQRALLEEDR